MQLFITPFSLQNANLTITEDRVISQCIKVLRFKTGSECYVQREAKRYHVCIIELDKQKIVAEVIGEVLMKKQSSPYIHLMIAVPNNFSKAELIVQKCCEIGIEQLTFRPSEKSQIRDMPAKKLERLQAISLEAVEQSRGWKLPTINFSKQFPLLPAEQQIIVFDTSETQAGFQKSGNIVAVIGPEGGLSLRDYQDFGNNITKISLGETVLRMETAVIVGAWYVKNAW